MFILFTNISPPPQQCPRLSVNVCEVGSRTQIYTQHLALNQPTALRYSGGITALESLLLPRPSEKWIHPSLSVPIC